MKIKEQLDQSIDLIHKIKAIEAKWTDIEKKDQSINSEYEDLLQKYPCNSLIIASYLNFSQLTHSEELVADFDVDDMEKYYDAFKGVFRDNVDLNLDSAYFKFNVMDKEQEAITELNNYKEEVLAKFEKAQSYFDDIQSGNY